MKLLRRRAALKTTFKDRVDEFWAWFPTVADELDDLIRNGTPQQVHAIVLPVAERTLPTLAWSFAPREDGDGHLFTVTGEGDRPRQLLAEYWHGGAVALAGWEFAGSVQPVGAARLGDLRLVVGGAEIDAAQMRLSLRADEDRRLVDVVAWHPAFPDLAEDARVQVVFLLLDEALGELSTGAMLGAVEALPHDAAATTVALPELRPTLRDVFADHEWPVGSPLELRSLYQFPEGLTGPRSDTIVGQSVIPQLVFAYAQGTRGPLLEGTGAFIASLAIDSARVLEGDAVSVRADIEDALDEELLATRSGRVLGGATGVEEIYVEMLLTDGLNSREIVGQVCDQLSLRDASRIAVM